MCESDVVKLWNVDDDCTSGPVTDIRHCPGRLSLLREAMEGERGADQKRIADVGLQWIETLLRKNADYGSSAWKVPVLTPGLDPGAAILVRMSDKIERVATLLSSGQEGEVAESIEDTITDLGGYCLLYLARPEN